MDLELVTVGNELLLGFTLNTNARDLARTLAPAGVRVVRHVTVGDTAAEIQDAVVSALDRTGFVIVSGGLGPTADDLTREAVAEAFGLPLEIDPHVLRSIEARFARVRPGQPMPQSNRKQAAVPAGAQVLENSRGTAPGLWIDRDGQVVVLLPGVPRELNELVRAHVIPRIQSTGEAARVVASRVLRTTGISESALANLLDDRLQAVTEVEVAFLPSLEGVDVRLTAAGPRTVVSLALDAAEAVLRPVLGAHCYGTDDDDLAALVLSMLRSRGASLAVAESCTGGLIGARLTEIPGSSDVFLGGVTAYANAAKIREVHVDWDVLTAAGAVSEEAVRAMALGVQARFGATAGVAITGIAGPSGGTADKPVGTVWIGAAMAGDVAAVKRHLPGTRYEVRRRAAQAALDLLRRLLAD